MLPAHAFGFSAELLFLRQKHTLLYATLLQQQSPIARAVWAGVAPVHRPIVRLALERHPPVTARVATMTRDTALDLLHRLHKAQNEFYAGGSGAALEQLLASDITWTVPGDSRIAGTYRGLGQVLGYFRRRRDLADHTFQMKRRDVLVGDGDHLAALTDGFATIRGIDYRWSTVGLYEVIDRQIAACWLLPLDQRAFDAIWTA